VIAWLIDKSALVRLHATADPAEWAARIDRGLIRISTVTRLEVGYSARTAADHRALLTEPPISSMPVEYITPRIEQRALELQSLLAERPPTLTLVIDHLAKPPIAAGDWDPWAHLLADAAACENTVVKLSGLNTAAAPGASSADYQRYIDHALDVFGPRRTMYGGDWPFALLAADSYTEVWRHLRVCLDGLDPGDRHEVLAGTAQRAYRLSAPGLRQLGEGGTLSRDAGVSPRTSSFSIGPAG